MNEQEYRNTRVRFENSLALFKRAEAIMRKDEEIERSFYCIGLKVDGACYVLRGCACSPEYSPDGIVRENSSGR